MHLGLNLRDPLKLFVIIPHHLLELVNGGIERLFGLMERLQEFLFADQHEPSESVLDIHNHGENCISLDLYFKQAVHLFLNSQRLPKRVEIQRHHPNDRQDDQGKDQDNFAMDRQMTKP